MITIKDIAEKAGVSFSTVSKVLNNYPDVSAETKDKVLKVIEEFNFIPNSSARKLAQKNRTTLGIIISGLEQNEPGDISALQILKGVLNAAQNSPYEIVFYPVTTYLQHQKSFHQFCNENNLAGAILSGLQTDDPYFEQAANSTLPCVTIDFVLPGPNNSALSVDNVEAAYSATMLLINNGHRKIGAVNGKENSVVGLERYAGYCQALLDSDIPVQKEYVCDAEFSEETAYEKSLIMLSLHPELTAVVCASDVMAAGVYRAAEKLGKTVGVDLAITGFDDFPIAGYLNPPLTTIRQNFFQFGVDALHTLTQMLEGHKKTKKHVFTEYELIIRNSTYKIIPT